MKEGKKIYFISDMHLGLPNFEGSLKREKILVKWLNEIRQDAEEIYLLGDIFDFWHDYKWVAPRGFTRFLGTIADITDRGIPVHFFTGNHDIWAYNYLPEEIGVIMHREPFQKEYNGKKFYLAHGDGLGPYDKGYKLLKWVFTSKVLQWMFSRLHPNFALALGHKWSRNRRPSVDIEAEEYKGDSKEWLYLYSNSILEKEHFDFFIYGHRHVFIKRQLKNNSFYINLGDWISKYSYAYFDGEEVYLKKYKF